MLEPEKLNKSLIHTDTGKCIGCSKCIHRCPILRANVCAADDRGNYKVYVDERECILCGTCTDACHLGARRYKDDYGELLLHLNQGRPISALVAPALYLIYPTEYKKIFGYLRSLGIKNFYPVSFGAEISVWGYLNYITSQSAVSFISGPCPAIVRNIEMHRPELIKSLVPIQSPMMCAAIYLKEYEKIEDDLVFLSPCIAKKSEMQSKRGRGLIKYNVTFKSLFEHIIKDADLSKYPEADDELEYGMGYIFPNSGGLRTNIEYYLGPTSTAVSIEGVQRSGKFLESFTNHINENDNPFPVLIDILNCSMGCSYGTGVEESCKDSYTAMYQGIIMRRKKYGIMKNEKSAETYQSPSARLKHLNQMFAHLKPEDFICEYEANVSPRPRAVCQAEIDGIFRNKLMKHSEDDQNVDCFACGYTSCREMAEAIALGINHQERCVFYVRTIRSESILTEQKLKAMLDASPHLCAILDMELGVLEVNEVAVEMFGLNDKQEFIDMTLNLLPEFQPCGTHTAEVMAQAFDTVFQTGTASLEFVFQTLDGSTLIPCEAHLRKVNLEEKNVVMIYMRDLRGRKELLAQLQAALEREKLANQAKTKFLSNMSHEIRTPMNAVVGITEMQLHKGSHSPETEEAFYRILHSSNLLLSIINDILDLSKVEAGKMEIINGVYDTADMIVSTIQLNMVYLSSKNIEYILEVDENLPAFLIGDEMRVNQVLNNIISNAFKYTEEGEVRLSFRAEPADDDSCVNLVATVSDTGQGMTKEQVEALFTEFTRFNLASNRGIEGSGLGMVIAHKLAKMMDGDIEVESEPGAGSTFTVRFPQKKHGGSVLGAEAAARLEKLETARKSLRAMSKLDIEPMPYGNVLVVDDVESNLFVARGILKNYELTVETASSGQEAIDKIASGSTYDIIFMDHMMPEMDGIETTIKLRESGYDLPIVALTANAFIDSVQMFMDNGFSGFVSKPIEVGQLDKQLKRFIRDKQPPEVLELAKAKAGVVSKAELSVALQKSFVMDAKKAVSIIEPLVNLPELNDADIKACAIQAHSMKSAFYNVGKYLLSKTAENLENAAFRGEDNSVVLQMPQFLIHLNETIEEFELLSEQLSGSLQDAPEEDSGFIREQMRVILEGCESFDIEAVKAAVQALDKISCSKRTRDVLNLIGEHLLSGDFDEAGNAARKAVSEFDREDR